MTKKVLFEPFPKQQEFIDAVFSFKYRYLCYGGGIRGGKTFAGLATIILLARIFPYTRWAIVRDSLPTLKRNTIPSWNKIAPTNAIERYNQDTQLVTFKNGSEILFFSENYDDDKELNRWRGLEVNGFLLEEANELQYASFLKAIERAGSHIPRDGHKKPPPIIMATVNPSWGWVKEQFYDRNKNGTLPANWKFIQATIFDNPAITEDADYMESLKELPTPIYRSMVLGDWDVNLNEHPWLYAFRDTGEPKTHLRTLPILSSEPIYLTFDINADPLSCTAWQRSRHMGGLAPFLHGIGEFGGHMKVDDICQQILTKFPNHIFYVTGDRSGQNQDVGRNQTVYEMVRAHLGISERQMNLNTHNLEHQDSRLLCNTIFEHYPIYIDPDKCPNLVADIRKAQVDQEHKLGNQLRKDRGEYKMDYFDGMRYLFQTYYLEYIREHYLRSLYR